MKRFTYFTTMEQTCPNCPSEEHFYCKSLVTMLFLTALDTGKPQVGKLRRCGKQVEVKLK